MSGGAGSRSTARSGPARAPPPPPPSRRRRRCRPPRLQTSASSVAGGGGCTCADDPVRREEAARRDEGRGRRARGLWLALACRQGTRPPDQVARRIARAEVTAAARPCRHRVHDCGDILVTFLAHHASHAEGW
eukprot:2445638-Prymnesium_polylepis.1